MSACRWISGHLGRLDWASGIPSRRCLSWGTISETLGVAAVPCAVVPAIKRKTAMRVRGGRVAKKNDWAPDARDYYARPQSEIQIERTDPGPSFRHVVTVAQLRKFLVLLPDWDELAIGLEAISIWRGNVEWVGLSNPGVVVITAWPREMWLTVDRAWVDKEAELFERLQVEIVGDPGIRRA
jgi:hypothetical protein